ncbi:MAG: DUF2273 domain-containing protein [Spirochaetota bacterium]
MNPGKTLGALAGFVLGLLLFTFGILKTLVIILLIGTGFFLGKARDDNVSIIDELSGFFKKNRDNQ